MVHTGTMETAFDWISVALFAGLALLYLQRSTGEPVPGDRIVAYLPPAAACALGNWLGNEGYGAAGALMLAAVPVYAMLVLRPFGRPRA
jgi:hypothetical protein